MDHLDLYSPEVYRFLDTLFLEYAGGPDPVFSGKYVHIGTDEYNSAEAEQFRKFMAHYIDYISSLGKTPVIWGSLKYMGGETPVPTGKCIANAWSHDWLDVGTALEGDYAGVVNLCDTYLYIVPGADYYHDFLDLRLIYEDWSPESMGRGEEGMSGNPKFLGSMFAVWNDLVGNGVSQQDVHFRTFPALQVMSEKLWHGDDGSRLPFGEFIDLCRRTPEAPGVNLSAKIHGPAELFPAIPCWTSAATALSIHRCPKSAIRTASNSRYVLMKIRFPMPCFSAALTPNSLPTGTEPENSPSGATDMNSSSMATACRQESGPQ